MKYLKKIDLSERVLPGGDKSNPMGFIPPAPKVVPDDIINKDALKQYIEKEYKTSIINQFFSGDPNSDRNECHNFKDIVNEDIKFGILDKMIQKIYSDIVLEECEKEPSHYKIYKDKLVKNGIELPTWADRGGDVGLMDIKKK